MSDEVFKQDLSQGGSRPGGPFMIQLLFKEAVEMPKKEEMLAVMQKYFKEAECFSYDEKMAGFALNDHKAEFKDGKVPVQLMIMNCTDFGGQGFDPFLMSQMWDCMEDRDRIFEECSIRCLQSICLPRDFLQKNAPMWIWILWKHLRNCIRRARHSISRIAVNYFWQKMSEIMIYRENRVLSNSGLMLAFSMYREATI